MNVTCTFGTGTLLTFVTVAWSWVKNAVATVALCDDPPVALIEAGTRTKFAVTLSFALMVMAELETEPGRSDHGITERGMIPNRGIARFPVAALGVFAEAGDRLEA